MSIMSQMECLIFVWNVVPTISIGNYSKSQMDIHDNLVLPINPNPPRIMHVDLNSCFATVTQQAQSHLRGKPVLIAAYDSPRGCVVAPSIEAKKYGVKTGNRVMEARMLAPNAIVRTPDTALIRDVHIKFKKICADYSPKVTPKSIDEVVIDMEGMEYFLRDRSMIDIAKEIKSRLRSEVGSWLSCSIGISTNRFLAKVASSFHKPDGLTVIDHNNLEDIYRQMELTDLPYIKLHNQARLNACGIFTPLEMLSAHPSSLRNDVFESIIGIHWYRRIRGWEVDDRELDTKSIGQEYSLQKSTLDRREIASIVMKLCEKIGRRLRRSNQSARGVHVASIYTDRTWWHKGETFGSPIFATADIYRRAQYILDKSPFEKNIAKIAVSVYSLQSSDTSQMSLFDTSSEKLRSVSQAVDEINDRYGEFVVTPAIMMGMTDKVIDRISFGNVRELEDLYAS